MVSLRRMPLHTPRSPGGQPGARPTNRQSSWRRCWRIGEGITGKVSTLWRRGGWSWWCARRTSTTPVASSAYAIWRGGRYCLWAWRSDLTRRVQVRILRARPFHSLADFLARVDPRPAEAENLIRTGALEGFGTIPSLLSQLKRGWDGGQLPLFELGATRGMEVEEDWSLAEKMAAQEAILGVGVVAHPLELVAEQLASAGTSFTLVGA